MISAGKTDLSTYLFEVELVEEEDCRWNVGVPALPGCATWGFTREEALHNIRDAVEAYLRDVRKAGKDVPEDPTTRVFREPLVAVTL